MVKTESQTKKDRRQMKKDEKKRMKKDGKKKKQDERLLELADKCELACDMQLMYQILQAKVQLLDREALLMVLQAHLRTSYCTRYGNSPRQYLSPRSRICRSRPKPVRVTFVNHELVHKKRCCQQLPRSLMRELIGLRRVEKDMDKELRALWRSKPHLAMCFEPYPSLRTLLANPASTTVKAMVMHGPGAWRTLSALSCPPEASAV